MTCREAALWGSAASRGCWDHSGRSGYDCTDVCIYIVRIFSSQMMRDVLYSALLVLATCGGQQRVGTCLWCELTMHAGPC